MIMLDCNGRKIALSRGAVSELRDAAAIDAGSSSARRDLAYILERALAQAAPVALRRAEVQALRDVIADHGLDDRFGGLL